MEKFKKILAPVDLSSLSKTGLSYALEIAKAAPGGEVLAYNVIPPGETPYPQAAHKWFATHGDLPQLKKVIEERKALLAKFIAENFAGLLPHVSVREEVEIGIPHRKIVEKALQEKVDMVVICTHGRTGLRHMLIGSVSEQIVRRAPCPVLTVPPPRETRRERLAKSG
ncbi:MAG TPA: universal stress protein [Candidatus Acidoferrales bacterium]|nr:universal stress protein [Candidatus Acidoferrales bacterium]